MSNQLKISRHRRDNVDFELLGSTPNAGYLMKEEPQADGTTKLKANEYITVSLAPETRKPRVRE